MPVLLQINSNANVGSTGRIAEEIGLKAIENGWTSYIAYGRNARPSKSRKIKIGNKLGIYWHILITRLFDRHGLGSKKATKDLLVKIKEINPDVIHLHNLHGYYLNYEILFSFLKTNNIPIVWTLHDCWSFTGHCAHFSFARCNKWQKECYQCPQTRKYPKGLIFDRSKLNFSDKKRSFTSGKDLITLVPVSNWLADSLSQSFFEGANVKRIYNGIDIEIFKPVQKENRQSILQKYNIENKFLILGVASIWGEGKGLNDFISLSRLLNDDYVLLLVGLSKKQIKSLPDAMIGVEKTENIEALGAIYSTADVFFNPTWKDTFPTTNIEALACGTPVITYKTGGSVEAVSDDTGFIVEQGDMEGVLKAIEIIKTNGKDKYSDNCRKRAIAKFNKEDRYKEYIDIYKELLKNK